MMRAVTTMGAAAVAIAGCAAAPETVAEAPAAGPVRPAGPAGPCDALAARGLVGNIYVADHAERAKTLSGASAARALRPGQVVTMEYRADRINIRLDVNGRIQSLDCG